MQHHPGTKHSAEAEHPHQARRHVSSAWTRISAHARLGATLLLAASPTAACTPAAVETVGTPDAAKVKPAARVDAAVDAPPDARIAVVLDAFTAPVDLGLGEAAVVRVPSFPGNPLLANATVPANAPSLFAGAGRASGVPCIVSPEPNTLMPRNWLRPRIEFVPAGDENLFEILISVTGFAHPLRVYANERAYTIDAETWSMLRESAVDRPIKVSVRALKMSADGTVRTPPSPAASTTFTIAPVEAPGKIVYWAILGGALNAVLRGFGIGEENVVTVLASTQLVPPTIDKPNQQVCVGCHTATPDGKSVGFSMGPPYWFRNSIADITPGSVGQKPAYASDAQIAVVRKLMGVPSFSRGHWEDGDRIALLMDGAGRGDLMWINLDTDGEQGILQRSGDARKAVLPSFSHDGTKIAYVSANAIKDGRLDRGPSDIYVVPYNDRAGGVATPVAGAADPKFTEYYPAFSPDDAYIAFARVAGNANSYSNSAAEIFVVPTSGGTATRFAANDPVACGKTVRSPGAGNDWPKWSPDVKVGANGRTYYWVTFSSIRRGRPQLFLAPMTVEGGVVDASYPALYLWNQPATENNHTPSWDNYQIPDAPPPPQEPPPIVVY